MNLKNKIGIAVGTLVISGGLLVGAAMASEAPTTTDPTAQVQGAAKAGPISEAAKAVLTQLSELRKSYMDKFQADAKSVIDQAVKDGKITQDEADKLLKHDDHFMGGKGHGGRGGGHGMMGPKGEGFRGGPGHFGQDLKAKLDAAVKAGTLTQEQADKLLEQFAAKPAAKNQ